MHELGSPFLTACLLPSFCVEFVTIFVTLETEDGRNMRNMRALLI